MKFKYLYTLALIISCFSVGISAQEQSRHPGILLYEQGKHAEAVSVLEAARKQEEFKADAEIWNYLGLAYFETAEIKKARKALEKAVELAPEKSVYRSNLAYAYLFNRQIDKAQSQADKAIELDPLNVTAYYIRGAANLWEHKLDDAESDADRLISINPGYCQGYNLKSDVLMAVLGDRVSAGSTVKDEIDYLKRANDALTSGVANCKNSAGSKELNAELESIGAFYKYFNKDKSEPAIPALPPEPGVTPFKILSKPRASYSDKARNAGVQGTIRLAVLLGASGKVEHILVLKRLGYGLDEQAVHAARQIKFEPKMRDGKPVSTVVIFEYGFNIY